MTPSNYLDVRLLEITAEDQLVCEYQDQSLRLALLPGVRSACSERQGGWLQAAHRANLGAERRSTQPRCVRVSNHAHIGASAPNTLDNNSPPPS